MDRYRLREIGAETLEILRKKSYSLGNGKVQLQDLIENAQRQTVTFAPEEKLLLLQENPGFTLKVEIRNETSLDAARRLEDRFGFVDQVGILNFASARNPGGGFRNGAQAQEESLARASALVSCIENSPLYAANRQDPRHGLYSDHVIFSPEVPVFRDEHDRLVKKSKVRRFAFVTCPAPNRKVMGQGRDAEAALALRKRAARVLACFANGHQTALVLGAWGCGVFRNSPSEVAEIFADLLDGPFRGYFKQIVFAVYSRQGENVQEFEAALAHLVEDS